MVLRNCVIMWLLYKVGLFLCINVGILLIGFVVGILVVVVKGVVLIR